MVMRVSRYVLSPRGERGPLGSCSYRCGWTAGKRGPFCRGFCFLFNRVFKVRIQRGPGLHVRVLSLCVGFGRLHQAYEGHLVDALALRGDEGRGTLR
jgi:hypothetical protein